MWSGVCGYILVISLLWNALHWSIVMKCNAIPWSRSVRHTVWLYSSNFLSRRRDTLTHRLCPHWLHFSAEWEYLSFCISVTHRCMSITKVAFADTQSIFLLQASDKCAYFCTAPVYFYSWTLLWRWFKQRGSQALIYYSSQVESTHFKSHNAL